MNAKHPNTTDILNTIPLACYVLDDKGNFTFINQLALKFFHRNENEMLGKHVWELFPESKNTNYFEKVNDAITNKKQSIFEYISVFTKTWIKLIIKPLEEHVLVTFDCIEKDKHHENLYKTLVENTPDIVTKWNSNLQLTYANNAFIAKSGVQLEDAIGKTHREIWKQKSLPLLIKKTRNVFETGKLQNVVAKFTTPNGDLFYDIKLAPEFTTNEKITGVIAIGRDITELKRHQDAYHAQLNNKYRSLFNSINQGFCIIEMIWSAQGEPINYRFVETNPAFEKQTGMLNAQGKTILDFKPDIEHYWIETYGRIAKSKQSGHFEFHTSLINGWFEVEAFPITEMGNDFVGVLFNDVTERKKVEQVLINSDEKRGYLLKLTDAIRFISDPLDIQEAAATAIGEQLNANYAFYGHVVLVNETEHIQIERLYQKHKNAPFKPSLYPFSDLAVNVEELRTGKTIIISRQQLNDVTSNSGGSLHQILQSFAWVAVPLIKNDKLVAVLMVQHKLPHSWTENQISLIEETAERTWSYVEQANIAKELNHSQEQLAVALTASNMSTFHWLSKNGNSVVSPLSSIVFGLKNNIASYSESEGFFMIHPEDRQRHLEVMEKACKEETEFHQIYRIIRPIDGKLAWIEERGKGIFHPHSGILEVRGIHWDITAQKEQADLIKKAEEQYLVKLEKDVNLRTKELKESRDELAAIYNNTLMSISVLSAVRDENGKITDFKFALVNRALEKETGRKDLINKLYAAEYPGILKVGVFDTMLKVMETGRPATLEYFYPYEDFNKWYSCMFVKMGDGLLTTLLDITERKIAEQLSTENSAMIQGIANSAPDMLYAINLDTMQQFYSNYRIEQLVEKSQVEIKKMGKDFFERFIHPDDKASFYHSFEKLKDRKHQEITALTYRLIDAKGEIHWITTKSTVYMHDDRGNSTHIVGISQDITQQITLEDRNKQLTKERQLLEQQQQREILRATLNAQEEERQRIAESLHNGLGQVLYGVKATLERVKLDESTAVEYNNKAINRSKELLGMCIAETRKISHELMPSILEDFGLKAAIRDICEQMKGETNFNCTFSGVNVPLEKYLQLAIYRIAQELALNIAKHANAKTAHIDVSIQQNLVHVTAKDNGLGFPTHANKNKGIGLKTIESKVKLLNGKMEITSLPQQTSVHIQFPI